MRRCGAFPALFLCSWCSFLLTSLLPAPKLAGYSRRVSSKNDLVTKNFANACAAAVTDRVAGGAMRANLVAVVVLVVAVVTDAP